MIGSRESESESESERRGEEDLEERRGGFREIEGWDM